MSKPVVEVQVRAVAAMSGGCAVFLGNEDKVFVMLIADGRRDLQAMLSRRLLRDLPRD